LTLVTKLPILESAFSFLNLQNGAQIVISPQGISYLRKSENQFRWRFKMNISKWFRGRKSSQAESANPKTDSTNQEISAAQNAEVIPMLERMVAEEPDLSGFDLAKLQESVAVGQRHAQMLKRMGSQLIPGLSQALRHANPQIRIKACWSMQILGSSNSLPDEALVTMAGLLSDSDQRVRQQAVGSLGVLGAAGGNLTAVMPYIVAASKSPDRKVRKSIAEMLGKMGANAQAALDSLNLILHDQDIDVAEAAKAAILKLGGKVDAPAPGSMEEVEHLAGLTSSSDDSIKKKAWAELEKLPEREIAIAPLMMTFRSRGGKALGTNLPKFLGKVGTEAGRAALMEILDYSRHSSDPWEQEYLTGSVCAALLSLQGGVSALQPVMPVEDLQFVIAQGLMSADQRERPGIADMLTIDERRRTITNVISSFRSAPEKGNLAWKVSGTLGSLGIDAVEPLLEVLRSVKPGVIQPNGSVRDGEGGEDGAPAVALVRIPGCIEKIKAICLEDEYERILVRAHQYGDFANPALNLALGEIATPKAIARLVFVLWQSHLGEETRKPAREALVKAGQKAHEELLKALKNSWPANRPFQTSLRKEVLVVLEETGDEKCLSAIQSILTTDPTVTEQSRVALEAIAKRCGINLPSDMTIPHGLPLKKVAKTGDPYIDDCFTIDFEEMVEDRDWFKISEAKAIPDASNAGLIDDALHLAEELRKQQPDFYFSYYWLGVLFRKQKRPIDGRKILLEGLNLCRSKQSLCTALGDLEWEQHNLSEAVKWWIKSVAVQVGAQYVTDYGAFLHLSYVAEGLGIGVACLELRDWVDRVRSGQIRLNGQAANEFYGATSRQGTPAMRLAIELLEKNYLSKPEE
jgi:HEAT repeat protein